MTTGEANSKPLFYIDAEVLKNPYPMYARLREVAPIHEYSPGNFILTRYADLVAALRDPRFGRAGMEAGIAEAHGLAGQRLYILPMMFADPPDHTRLRNVLNRAFTLRVVEALTPKIERVTNELLDKVAGRESFDLVESFAYGLPITTICHLLGMPEDEHEKIHELSDAHAAALTGGGTPEQKREVAAKAHRLRLEWAEYFRKLAERKRTEPGEDIVSNLVRVHDGTDKLTEYELLATMVGLLFAGHTTTADSIATGVNALLTHRDQWELLVQKPEHLDTAVEELLRWEPAVEAFSRVALEDAEFAGFKVPKGGSLLSVAGGANRDPAVFTDPERFDITRNPNRHVTFGSGIHFCMGSTLARVQLKIAIKALITRYPNLRLAAEAKYRLRWGFRGLQRLDVLT